MQLTDRETVESISENPYMQYFIGLSGFEIQPPFHHSMVTHFREALVNVLAELNELVAIEAANETKDDDDNDSNGGVRGKAKRAYKKNAPSVTAEQQTMFRAADLQSEGQTETFANGMGFG